MLRCIKKYDNCVHIALTNLQDAFYEFIFSKNVRVEARCSAVSSSSVIFDIYPLKCLITIPSQLILQRLHKYCANCRLG